MQNLHNYQGYDFDARLIMPPIEAELYDIYRYIVKKSSDNMDSYIDLDKRLVELELESIPINF